MTAIGPGTPLICVTPNNPLSRCVPIYVGSIYFCEAVHSFPTRSALQGYMECCPHDGCDTVITLKGHIHPLGGRCGYCPNKFRPLNDGDTSLVDAEKEIEDVGTPTERQDSKVPV